MLLQQQKQKHPDPTATFLNFSKGYQMLRSIGAAVGRDVWHGTLLIVG